MLWCCTRPSPTRPGGYKGGWKDVPADIRQNVRVERVSKAAAGLPQPTSYVRVQHVLQWRPALIAAACCLSPYTSLWLEATSQPGFGSLRFNVRAYVPVLLSCAIVPPGVQWNGTM